MISPEHISFEIVAHLNIDLIGKENNDFANASHTFHDLFCT